MPHVTSPTRLSVLAWTGLLALPLAVGAFASTGWSWGWDHLHRVPVAWPVMLAALATALAIPSLSRRFLSACDTLGGGLARNRLAVPLAAAALAAAAFAAFPIATRAYGDSHTILLHHTPAALATHARQFVSLGVATRGAAVYLLHDVLERLTGLSYEHCFMALSILSGVIFVAAHLRLAATLPGLAGWARLAIAWLGLTDGANQLFFGHVETYAIPRLFACLFLMALTRTSLDPDRPTRRLFLWLPLVAAIALHLQWLVLLPSGLLLLAHDLSRNQVRWRPLATGRTAAIGMGAATLLLAAVFMASGATCYDYLYTGGNPQLRQIFLPLGTACAHQPYLRYTLLSPPHLLDFAGSFYAISSPAVLLAIALLWRRHRAAGGLVLLLPAVAAGLLHNAVINPSIGFPFDWDMLCVVSPPLLYTAVYLVALAGRSDGGALPPARPAGWLVPLFVLGLATTTMFVVNASAARAYTRVEDMAVWLHRTYYGNSHYRLSTNLSTITDPARQDSERERVLERLRPQAYPDDREVAFLWEKLGSRRAERAEYPAAIAAYREALRTEPARWQRKRPLGFIEFSRGDAAASIRLLDEYLQQAPADADAWLVLADACAQRGLDDRARACRERFLQLAPAAPAAEAVRRELARRQQDPPR